ncbi:M24 family metallopeptidase [Mycolicibacterium vaccae]|uniref:Dipeptidase n=1 Tax=Mycolicibacterium vaccae ATCC 25954 TaxID=1194972 RepID=K0VHE0_MYCVA|nr:Xaa-Pro peptidase family protein [Mycolicibacterium vaccae]ANI41998.1 dipeptidase [Mycolicibacterium vaccae 95051]EJZ10499.1 dipeptidase [Mycolicibacterium vaccae ATCC 25954]MCV7061261.1 aminopeptidase P family protein [Mycolicibacterium vaccae]
MSAIPQQLHFSVEEYRARLLRTQAEMERHGLDALLLHQPENIAWLSGFWHDGFFAYHSLVVPSAGEPILVERRLEDPVAQELSWVADRRGYFDGEDPESLAADAVAGVTPTGARIGVELNSAFLPVTRFHRLSSLMSTRELVSHNDIVEDLRQIKSEQEISYIRTAGRIASAAVTAGLRAARVGATELDVAAAVAQAQAEHGHDSFFGGVGGTICSGWRTIQLHGQQTGRILEQGDRLRLELPGIYRQYWAKQMRSTVLGRPGDALLRAHDILRTAQDAAIEAMAPGVPAAHIAELCRRPVLDAQLIDRYENRVGYGLGLQFHPTSGDFTLDIDHRSHRKLESGMVFHMLLFAAGAAISETVVVTDDGCEVLTDGARALPQAG